MTLAKNKDRHQSLAFQAPGTHIEDSLEETSTITVEIVQTRARTIVTPSTLKVRLHQGHTPKTFTLIKAGDGTQKPIIEVATHLLFPDLLDQDQWIVPINLAH